MDEVRRLLNSYNDFKSKTIFVKELVEHYKLMNETQIKILDQTIQIPRDINWEDDNLVEILEMTGTCKNIYENINDTFVNLRDDITKLIERISEDMEMLKDDLANVIKQSEKRISDLEEAKRNHIDSWLKGRDPWITDVKLKVAIKNLYNFNDSDNKSVKTSICVYNDKLSCLQEVYIQLLEKFIRTNKFLYSTLQENTNIKIKQLRDNVDNYKTTNSSQEIIEEKILNAYEEITNNINNVLLANNIPLHKNIEPIKYGIAKIKNGIANEWNISFVAVTKSKYLHFINFIQSDELFLRKYKHILIKIRNTLKRPLVPLFDFNKNTIGMEDREIMKELANDIKCNIEKFIDNVYLTMDLRTKEISIDKNKSTILINDKSQNGIYNLFGINVIKMKCFSMNTCYEIFFSMKYDAEEINPNIKITEESLEIHETSTNVKYKNIVENPWEQTICM